MGRVFKPIDVVKRRRIVEEALRDLSPGLKEDVVKILESWEEVGSREKLVKLLGAKEAERILSRVRVSCNR